MLHELVKLLAKLLSTIVYKIIEFLSDQSKSEVEKNIIIKINEVKNSLNELIPNSCNEKIESLDKELIIFFENETLN